jgi:hypothetical protein
LFGRVQVNSSRVEMMIDKWDFMEFKMRKSSYCSWDWNHERKVCTFYLLDGIMLLMKAQGIRANHASQRQPHNATRTVVKKGLYWMFLYLCSSIQTMRTGLSHSWSCGGSIFWINVSRYEDVYGYLQNDRLYFTVRSAILYAETTEKGVADRLHACTLGNDKWCRRHQTCARLRHDTVTQKHENAAWGWMRVALVTKKSCFCKKIEPLLSLKNISGLSLNERSGRDNL